ncbi:Cyclin-dependent kinase 2 like protein [Plasmodiophora brassicae]
MSRMPLPSAMQRREPGGFVAPVFPVDDAYKRICQIGQGTFGVVYKALAPDGSLVALKALRLNDMQHGFSVTSVREIQILQRLNHENVISITDIVASKDAHLDLEKAFVYVVFPYMEHDLAGLLDNPSCRITPPVIKCYFKQIVTGIEYLHENGLLHRDIKCSNILINNYGIVKLGDFGLARPVRSDAEPYTDKVCTLWYRAPELLLGDMHYGPPLDIWSLGCVFAEMFTQRPILHGATEIDQLDRIFKLCGTPTNLPAALNGTALPATSYPRQVKKAFANFGAQESDLLDRMLELDPAKRITAAEILKHPYFTSYPPAVLPEQVPRFTPSNEFSAAKRKGLPARPPPDVRTSASAKRRRSPSTPRSRPATGSSPSARRRASSRRSPSRSPAGKPGSTLHRDRRSSPSRRRSSPSSPRRWPTDPKRHRR